MLYVKDFTTYVSANLPWIPETPRKTEKPENGISFREVSSQKLVPRFWDILWLVKSLQVIPFLQHNVLAPCEIAVISCDPRWYVLRPD